MSNHINKDSGFDRLKRLLFNNLWFVLLMMPLIIIPLMVVKGFNWSQVMQQHSEKRGLQQITSSLDLSAAELTSIVAKPLGELLAMDVYPEHGISTASVPANTKKNDHLLTKRLANNRLSIGYQSAQLDFNNVDSQSKQGERDQES